MWEINFLVQAHILALFQRKFTIFEAGALVKTEIIIKLVCDNLYLGDSQK
jgi:hypothetical protein